MIQLGKIFINFPLETSLLGLALNFSMPQLSKAVKSLDLGNKFRKRPISDVPTLLLTGTLDGRNSPKSQQDATQGLSNLTQIKIINGGHDIFMVSPKITDNIKLFLSGRPVKAKTITIDLPYFFEKDN